MMSNRFDSIPPVCYARRPFSTPPAMTPPILLSADVIDQRIRELGTELSRDYADAPQLHFICVLKGAFVFLADLVRAVDKPTTIDFLAVSSYAKGTTSTGEVRLLKDLDAALNGRDVLIVEDIVDTGLTLQYLQEILRARGPRTLRTVCLLSKPSRRKVDVPVDYIGFTIEDRFVVGYGLDFEGRYRGLPYIGVLDDEAGKPGAVGKSTAPAR
jgi:hypoxanthine phosphoribosyltransferase